MSGPRRRAPGAQRIAILLLLLIAGAALAGGALITRLFCVPHLL